MNLLILGGNSQRNKEWVHKVDSSVKDLFDKTIVHEYQHWTTGAEMVDFDAELDLIAAEVQNLGKYAIFAKSVGSILSMTLIGRGRLNPSFCVFAGVALKLARESGIEVVELLETLKCPTVIIQNDNDPVGRFEEVRSLVDTGEGIKLVETSGDDHSYDDLELIRSELEENLT